MHLAFGVLSFVFKDWRYRIPDQRGLSPLGMVDLVHDL